VGLVARSGIFPAVVVHVVVGEVEVFVFVPEDVADFWVVLVAGENRDGIGIRNIDLLEIGIRAVVDRHDLGFPALHDHVLRVVDRLEEGVEIQMGEGQGVLAGCDGEEVIRCGKGVVAPVEGDDHVEVESVFRHGLMCS